MTPEHSNPSIWQTNQATSAWQISKRSAINLSDDCTQSEVPGLRSHDNNMGQKEVGMTNTALQHHDSHGILQDPPQSLIGFSHGVPPMGQSWQSVQRIRPKMRTGCVTCLVKGIACDPQNPGCQLGMSDDWYVNTHDDIPRGSSAPQTSSVWPDTTLASLTLMRPDVKWQRSWRERHSLNFFVNYSAPQMAGFFDSSFWQRSVIQLSYSEPAVLHAITAIGSLHESILQGSPGDGRRKQQTIAFALGQCNKAISCLTTTSSDDHQQGTRARLALTTCILFTCFEAMQGRCDSAVNHALQGRRLLQSVDRCNDTRLSNGDAEQIEGMRPLIERLEVQATALLDRSKRSEVDQSFDTAMPSVELIYSLDHAHNTLHMAMNQVTRFMQTFDPSAPRAVIEAFMATKRMRFGPWFSQWEMAFTTFLSSYRSSITPIAFKQAMVLKANHLVGTMLATVDQSAGPTAYDVFEEDFRVIVDLANEVLISYACPPTPALSGSNPSASYLSFSLWVTDPLWMAISRCRNPAIRQSAFALLSQNPRQEGIWHGGPVTANNKINRKTTEKRKMLESQASRTRVEVDDDASARACGEDSSGLSSSTASRSSSNAKRTASQR